MISISLCMIVKNEEISLENCLKSVAHIVDEIIILDTGSTDNTKEIAKKYGAKVYEYAWCDNFAKARNKAFSYATKDYILWLDADDILNEENSDKLKSLKNSLDYNIDYVNMIYSLSRNSNNVTTCSIRRNRLVKRDMNFKWIGKIHEYLEVFGQGINSEIEIWHNKIVSRPIDRNLKIFRAMQDKNELFSSRDVYYFANELFDNQLYEEAIQQYETFIRKNDGFIEDKKNTIFNLAQCYININKKDKALEVLLKSLKYFPPKAEICCSIAYLFLDNNEIENAVFWYKVALENSDQKFTLGIDNKLYSTFIPAIQLCVCYCKLNDFKCASYYNEIAAKYNIRNDMIEHNRAFLKDKVV